MASSVLFASNHNVSVGVGSISTFLGTILAPNGTVTTNMGDWYGSIFAGGAIHNQGYLVKESYNFGNAALASFGAADTSIIVGGSKSISANLTNIAPAGGGTLNFTATDQVASGGLSLNPIQPTTGSLAPGASTTLLIPVTGTQIRQAKVSVNIADPNAYAPNTTGFATVNVLDHAAPNLVAGLQPGLCWVQRLTALRKFKIFPRPTAPVYW